MIADGRYELPNGQKASIIWHLKAVRNGILEMNLQLCDLLITMAAYIWPYKVKIFVLGMYRVKSVFQIKSNFDVTGEKEILAKFVGALLMDPWIFNFPVQAIWPLLILGTYIAPTLVVPKQIY